MTSKTIAAQAFVLRGQRRPRAPLPSSVARPVCASANFATLAMQLGHDVLRLLRPDARAAVAGSLRPGARWRPRSRPRARRASARRHQRADVLDRDELLEELLVQLGGEPDEDRARLVLGRVIVDAEQSPRRRHRRRPPSRRRGPAGPPAVRTPRSRRRRLDHDPVLELPAQPAPDRGNHARPGTARRAARGRDAPGERAIPVIARPSASATWDGRGRRVEPQQRLHRALHLGLASRAVAGDRALDLRGREREHVSRRAGGRRDRSSRAHAP